MQTLYAYDRQNSEVNEADTKANVCQCYTYIGQYYLFITHIVITVTASITVIASSS